MSDTEADAEERRRRNRESMRRVRLRKRDAHQLMQQTATQLEQRLCLLVERNRQASKLVASCGGSVPIYAGMASAYSRLLAETAALSLENQHLRENVRGFQTLQAWMARSLDDQRLESLERGPGVACSLGDERQRDGMEMLQPFLTWLTPCTLCRLMEQAQMRILTNMEIVESLVPQANMALGWSDQRCVDSHVARYLLRKTFSHIATSTLVERTWTATTDIQQLSGIMRWAQGMKVLHWLSADAAVVMRELDIPNPDGGDRPTLFRFMLLVFRMKCRKSGSETSASAREATTSVVQDATLEQEPEQEAQGEEDEDCYMVGTITLNIYGTSVDECLRNDVVYRNGVNARTMYGFLFRRLRDARGQESGCETTLVGLTSNGSDAYAHNVLMEMITVVLLWENALVGPILKLQN